MMGLDMPEISRGWRNIRRISCASSWVFFTTIISRCTVNNIKRLEALPTHRLSETASMGTVNLMLKTPRKLLPRFQLAICIHLDTVSDTPFGAALPVDCFTESGHGLWWTCTGLQGTALLRNSLSKNKSTATLVSVTTYSTGRQWKAWAVTRRKFDSRFVNDFFFDTTTKPVLTDSLASCQTHTKISFRGGKDTALLSSTITLPANEIIDVWSFTPISLRIWVPNPRPASTFANYIYCTN
jgi:hypothetical protein